MMLRTLISPTVLAALNESGEALIVDCRFELSDPGKGQHDYAQAHIPNAVYASLDRDLSDLSKPGLGRHPLPSETDFSRVLERWGWHSGMPVIAYDDASGALAAARLWWLLRLADENNVAVLDGGFAAWRTAGLPTTGLVPSKQAGAANVHFDSKQMIDYSALQHGLAEHEILLLDARGAARFRGEVEPIDRVAGHVPGARNRPFQDNLHADGRFKSADQLHAEFGEAIGDVAPDDVIHMCGSGVSACHNLLAMEHAGLAGSRLFAPSWSGWISDSTRSTAQGGE
ncbi:MAG: sulfurtransferase [Dokdonella sp.]